MKIIIPLFDFASEDNKEYNFKCRPYSIKQLDFSNEVPNIDLFSKQDIRFMKCKEWGIVIEGNIPPNYEEEINLLLIALRIATKRSAFIKYMLCKEKIALNKILHETMTHILEDEPAIVNYSVLNNVNEYFDQLLEMNVISHRTHNAIYFLYRAFHTTHWVDSFIFLVSFLESLFSKDDKRGATRTICTRVNNFISDPNIVTYDIMEKLYDVRSEMVHGKINLTNNMPQENLKDLKSLENISIAVLEKFIENNLYESYNTKEQREKLLMNYS